MEDGRNLSMINFQYFFDMCEYYYGFPLEVCHVYAPYILNSQAQTCHSRNQDSHPTRIQALNLQRNRRQ